MLDLFRSQATREIDPADAVSHVDVGVAFREMGLLDEAAEAPAEYGRVVAADPDFRDAASCLRALRA